MKKSGHDITSKKMKQRRNTHSGRSKTDGGRDHKLQHHKQALVVGYYRTK